MSGKNIWLTGFFLSFLSFVAVILFKLGWFQPLSYNYRKAKNLHSEFIHLRTLTTHNFQGKIAKVNSSDGYEIPKYPALYLIDKKGRKILDAHFPQANAEFLLQHFLNDVVNLELSSAHLLIHNSQYNVGAPNIASPISDANVATSKSTFSKNQEERKLIFQ